MLDAYDAGVMILIRVLSGYIAQRLPIIGGDAPVTITLTGILQAIAVLINELSIYGSSELCRMRSCNSSEYRRSLLVPGEATSINSFWTAMMAKAEPPSRIARA